MITFVLYLCMITKLNKTHTFNKVTFPNLEKERMA